MRKVMLTAVIALLGSGAMAQETNKLYGSMSSDSDKRHSLNFGYRFNETFSVEGSYNRAEDKGSYTNNWQEDGRDWQVGQPVDIICKPNCETPHVDPGDPVNVHSYKTVDKTEAVMAWGKAQYDWNQHTTFFTKVGIGRFGMDVDTHVLADGDTTASNSRSHYNWGYGLAAGVELAMTDNMYATVEYQHLKANKMGGVSHSEGGTTFGVGYKF